MNSQENDKNLDLFSSLNSHNCYQWKCYSNRPNGNHRSDPLSNWQLIEELAHFNRERIPEWVVHEKGNRAFGVFKVTNAAIKKYTKATLFDSVGKETEVAVRFSSVIGEQGSTDTTFGEGRGFAVKFYTEDGNWDLIGNNAPSFQY